MTQAVYVYMLWLYILLFIYTPMCTYRKFAHCKFGPFSEKCQVKYLQDAISPSSFSASIHQQNHWHCEHHHSTWPVYQHSAAQWTHEDWQLPRLEVPLQSRSAAAPQQRRRPKRYEQLVTRTRVCPVLCRRSAVRSTRSTQYARRSTRWRTPRSAGTAVEYTYVISISIIIVC